VPFIHGEYRIRTMRLHDLLHNVEKPDGPPLAASLKGALLLGQARD
jgi:hypothetical protein